MDPNNTDLEVGIDVPKLTSNSCPLKHEVKNKHVEWDALPFEEKVSKWTETCISYNTDIMITWFFLTN